ncbi:deoxynucleotide monophosphate kinase family protein [Streptomyces galilaeus]|uniref:deoxynucleotide monophosphate kinase family protein n=1 Tax=Streptomyces galilaeus TaxID=33899 RepID=UPI0038F8130E
MQDIALTGLARSGKDSVATRLVEHHGYVRVAFADKLKEAALKVDPMIPFPRYSGQEQHHMRLSAVVATYGWERAKDLFPEVRRFLQCYGQTVREMYSEFWITAARPAIREAWGSGRPVVVTDVRYANEADFLRNRLDFGLVRITRPGQTPGDHISEREMLGYQEDRTIVNGGSLEALAALADLLVTG